MDITNINPSAHADQDDFPIGRGRFVHIPFVAKGQAVTALARRLARGVEVADEVRIAVPESEAIAIATAVVDPSSLRVDLERRRFSLVTTPSGETLVTLSAHVWTAAVSCDGANGRSRLESKMSGESVWPAPDNALAEPVMRYVTRTTAQMRHAVVANAKRIASRELYASIANHPLGVWNAIDVVAGRVVVQPDPEAPVESEVSFVHSCEGSTRASTCQGMVGIDRDAALAYAGETLALVRRVRAGLAGRIAVSPDSEDTRLAIKVMTMPANIIIGAIGVESRPSPVPFPQVISEFVQGIHEEPRPWNQLAQGGVRGERLVLDLADAGALTDEHADEIIARDDDASEIATPIDVLAGYLLRAASHPDNWDLLRRSILQDGESYLTSKRYRNTMGPLLLTIYRSVSGAQKTAVSALTSQFQPELLKDREWVVREELSLRDVLNEALEHVEANPGTLSPAARELVARSVGALATLGLVLADQGSSYSEKWLRSRFHTVIAGLATCAGGLKIMCEAAERAADAEMLMPALYDAEGDAVYDEDGNIIHLHPAEGANVKLRELAFRDRRPEDDDDVDEAQLDPYDRFRLKQRRASELTSELSDIVDDLLIMRDRDNRPLHEQYHFDRQLVGELPNKLADIRARINKNLEPEPQAQDADDDGIAALEGAIG